MEQDVDTEEKKPPEQHTTVKCCLAKLLRSSPLFSGEQNSQLLSDVQEVFFEACEYVSDVAMRGSRIALMVIQDVLEKNNGEVPEDLFGKPIAFSTFFKQCFQAGHTASSGSKYINDFMRSHSHAVIEHTFHKGDGNLVGKQSNLYTENFENMYKYGFRDKLRIFINALFFRVLGKYYRRKNSKEIRKLKLQALEYVDIREGTTFVDSCLLRGKDSTVDIFQEVCILREKMEIARSYKTSNSRIRQLLGVAYYMQKRIREFNEDLHHEAHSLKNFKLAPICTPKTRSMTCDKEVFIHFLLPRFQRLGLFPELIRSGMKSDEHLKLLRNDLTIKGILETLMPQAVKLRSASRYFVGNSFSTDGHSISVSFRTRSPEEIRVNMELRRKRAAVNKENQLDEDERRKKARVEGVEFTGGVDPSKPRRKPKKKEVDDTKKFIGEGVCIGVDIGQVRPYCVAFPKKNSDNKFITKNLWRRDYFKDTGIFERSKISNRIHKKLKNEYGDLAGRGSEIKDSATLMNYYAFEKERIPSIKNISRNRIFKKLEMGVYRNKMKVFHGFWKEVKDDVEFEYGKNTEMFVATEPPRSTKCPKGSSGGVPTSRVFREIQWNFPDRVKIVDENYTTKMCFRCHCELEKAFRKHKCRDGIKRNIQVRGLMLCKQCFIKNRNLRNKIKKSKPYKDKKTWKRRVRYDRDINAAKNIWLLGVSETRPRYLCRS